MDLETALLRISESTHKAKDVADFYAGLHCIVDDLIGAKSLSLMIRLPDSGRLRYEYYHCETQAKDNLERINSCSQADLEASLPAYAIRNARSLRLDRSAARALAQELGLPFEALPEGLIAVPLYNQAGVFGVIVVQRFERDRPYRQEDLQRLELLSQHIAVAIERKWADESLRRALDGLEARIKRRTAELSSAHAKLRREIQERERGENVQAALYRIAKLAAEPIDLETFCSEVHSAIGELMYAQNLFLALADEKTATLRYPYIVDQVHRCWPDDPIPSDINAPCGPTVAVLLSGEARLYGQDALPFPQQTWGQLPVAWLGVPLQLQSTPIGVLAIQSYDQDCRYSTEDVALLTFIARQVALSIRRREDQQALQRANGELVARVSKRTRALHHANRHLSETSVELQSMQKRWVESEHLITLGSLMTGISYELTAPITAAQQLMQQLPCEIGASGNAIDQINVALHQALATIEQLSKFASDQSTWVPRRFDLREELQMILNYLTQRLGHAQHHFDLHCETAFEVEGYPSILYLILFNLVNNSIQHAFQPDQHGHIDIYVEVVGEGFALRYRDDGRGLSIDARERLFEPFFLATSRPSSTGLGMHAVYNYVTRLGGTITVSECVAQGQGVTFELWLPCHCQILPQRPTIADNANA